MTREFTCAYANCRKTKVPIVISFPDERPRFCCAEHAAVSLVRRARLAHPEGSPMELKLMEIEKLMREHIGPGS